MKKIIDDEVDKADLIARLHGSFLLFTEVFFPLVTGREFKISQPTGRESHFITVARELTLAKRMQCPSLLINLPPGSGKSTLLSMWTAWTMAEYPNSQYLYISYGHELASKHTEFVRRIIQCPQYQSLFGIKIRHDMKARDHFVTEQGGSIKAFGSSGPVLGMDGGLPNCDHFTGAIICFPYNQWVLTEGGPKQIGEIVEQKLNVNVYSFNVKSNKIELKSISNWFKNPGSDLLEIECSNGVKLQCTPDHKIWTKNRGWVEAKNLQCSDNLFSPHPYSSLWHTQKLSSFSLRNAKVFQNSLFCFFKKLKFAFNNSLWLIMDTFCCFMFPSFTASNFSNINSAYFINSCHFSSASRIFHNRQNVMLGKFTTRMNFTHRKSTVLDGIFHIFRLTSITKIVGAIIKPISINMSSFYTKSLRAYKCPCNQTMHKKLFAFLSRQSKSYTPIFFAAMEALFFYPTKCFIWLSLITIKNYSLFLSNIAQIRNTIKSFVTGNCSPLFIRNIGHADTTYCINVDDNHNFFCGESTHRSILVSNCDDLHKVDEAHSQAMRERVIQNYRETILQRPRSPNVPIIFLGQRVHEADICSYMLSGNDERKWKAVIVEALDQAGNSFYPDVYPQELLLEKKDKNPYVFASQFQQNPIPAGGALFKERDFVLLDDEPTMLCTFITADTAETNKTYNDATVFSFWGLYKIKEADQETGQFGLHWLDCIELRIEPKELEPEFKSFYGECMLYPIKPLVAAIEKKSTGVTLVSVLQDMRGLEIREVKRTKASGSKAVRYLEMQPIIAAKLVSITKGAKHQDLVVKHMIKITANDSHRWDDIADTLYDACKIALIDKTLYFEDKKARRDDVLKSMANSHNMRINALQGTRR